MEIGTRRTGIPEDILKILSSPKKYGEDNFFQLIKDFSTRIKNEKYSGLPAYTPENCFITHYMGEMCGERGRHIVHAQNLKNDLVGEGMNPIRAMEAAYTAWLAHIIVSNNLCRSSELSDGLKDYMTERAKMFMEERGIHFKNGHKNPAKVFEKELPNMAIRYTNDLKK